MQNRANIVKVESRSKVYFDYAETKTYIWAQAQIGQSREQGPNLFGLCRDQDLYFLKPVTFRKKHQGSTDTEHYPQCPCEYME